MSICTGVIVAVAFQKVDRAPDTETCTKSYYQSLQTNLRITLDTTPLRIPVKRRARSGGTVRPFQRKRRSRSILNGVKRRPSVLSDQRSQFLTELRPLVS